MASNLLELKSTWRSLFFFKVFFCYPPFSIPEAIFLVPFNCLFHRFFPEDLLRQSIIIKVFVDGVVTDREATIPVLLKFYHFIDKWVCAFYEYRAKCSLRYLQKLESILNYMSSLISQFRFCDTFIIERYVDIYLKKY